MAPLQPAPPRVLLVDDDARLVHIVGLYLEAMGFDVVPAENGAAALRLLEAPLPDLVILDIVMPGLDGVSLCRKIRGLPGGRTLPILVITAFTDGGNVEAAMAAGADRVIVKPFNLTGLGAAVMSLLPETASASA